MVVERGRALAVALAMSAPGCGGGGRAESPAPPPEAAPAPAEPTLIVARQPRDRFRSFSFGPEPAVPGAERIRVEEPQLPDASGAPRWHTVVTSLDDAGAPRWRVDLPQWGQTTVGERVVAVHGERSLVIIDVATGAATEHPHDAPHPWPRAVVVGDRVVAASATGDGAGVIAGYDRGVRRWSRPLPVEHGGDLAIVDDLVFVQIQGGVLYALALDTGEPRWDLSLGDDLQLRADGARLRVATDDEVLEVDPRGVPPPIERAVITGEVGTVACGEVGAVVVAAGDTRTRPDASGAFAITVEARGELRVWIPGSVAQDASIALTGRGHYEVGALFADLCDYD